VEKKEKGTKGMEERDKIGKNRIEAKKGKK
jgi:hypothetical protein